MAGTYCGRSVDNFPGDVDKLPYTQNMTLQGDEVVRAGLALDAHERASVAHQLLDSLNPEDNESVDFDAAWQTTLQRRIDEIESGAVQLVSGEESRTRVRVVLAELGS